MRAFCSCLGAQVRQDHVFWNTVLCCGSVDHLVSSREMSLRSPVDKPLLDSQFVRCSAALTVLFFLHQAQCSGIGVGRIPSRSPSTLGDVGLRQRCLGLCCVGAEEFCRQLVAVFAKHGWWSTGEPGSYFPSSQVLSPTSTHEERISPLLQSSRPHCSQHLRHAKSPLPSWRKGPRVTMAD